MKTHRVHYVSSESYYGYADIYSQTQEDAERIFLEEWSKAEMVLNRFVNVRILHDKKEIRKWQRK